MKLRCALELAVLCPSSFGVGGGFGFVLHRSLEVPVSLHASEYGSGDALVVHLG